LGRRFGSWYVAYPDQLKRLMNQKGVIFRGRINQMELYQELFSSNIWWYPTNWPETSCISALESQSCGAIPVTSHYWALEDNILDGYKSSRCPQDNEFSKLYQIDRVCRLLENPDVWWRGKMQAKARHRFDWARFVLQISNWGKK
jgi:glycosyltransferase involved in cell wall biosynthesis